MLGGPILGHLSDRFGARRRPILLISCAFLAVFKCAFLFLSYNEDLTSIYIYIILFVIGFFTPSLIFTMVLSKELQDLKHSGLAVGIANSGGFVGAAFSQLVVGFILERGWEGYFSNGIMSYPWSAFQQIIVFSTLLLIFAFFSVYFVVENCTRYNVYKN